MIRHAREDDIPQLVELGREFYALTTLAAHTDYDPDSTAASLRQLLSIDSAAILVIDRSGRLVGAAGAIIAPLFFNANLKMANEMFWFVSEAHRGTSDSLRLFAALEQWAKNHGAVVLLMVALAHNAAEVGAVYRRKGYSPQETSFIKVL